MMGEGKKERFFITEEIVPRKGYKKILMIAGFTVLLAVLFGGIAGITFFVSQNALGKSIARETQPEVIVIARDDTEEAFEAERKKTTEAASESITETEGESRQQEASGEDSVTENIAERTSEVTEKAEILQEDDRLREVYGRISESLLTVRIAENSGTDWFDRAVTKTVNRFGVIIAETTENVFVLLDGEDLNGEEALHVQMSNRLIPAVIQGIDDLTGMAVIRIARENLNGLSYSIAKLGNSFVTDLADQVYLAGALYGEPGAFEHGFVTYCGKYEDVEDGYSQLLHTDMFRSSGGSGVLFTEEGHIIGWISDHTCGEGRSPVIAEGISPLKYIIEDLCSGTDTAYLGILCSTVSGGEAELSGLQEGFYVRQVTENSPAYLAGLQVGDRITKVGGKNVFSSHTLQSRLDALKEGNTIAIEVERLGVDGYEPLELLVKLAGR